MQPGTDPRSLAHPRWAHVTANSDESESDEEPPVVLGVLAPPIVVGVKRARRFVSDVRYNKTEAFLHGDKGTLVVRGDETPDVEWRTVPGFPEDRVLASSDGRIWARDMRGMERITRGNIRMDTQRATIEIDGRPYKFPHLIGRAFHGGSEGRTIDHGQDGRFKNGPDDEAVVPNSADNRACNLRWATESEQHFNQRKHKSRRRGMPVLVRSLDWDDYAPWQWFESAKHANKAKGVSDFFGVLHGKTNRSGRWVAKWAEPRETQDDLPGEIWVDAVGFNGRAQVSNMGRAWTINTTSKTKWGHKLTPRIGDGQDYAKFGRQRFHRVVFLSFGNTLKPGQTVDHIDRNPNNNKLSNLRAANQSEQVKNQDRRPASETYNDLKSRIEARPVDASPDAPWESFLGMAEAVRRLSARYPGKKFCCGGISAVCLGKRRHHLGFNFRFASRD